MGAAESSHGHIQQVCASPVPSECCWMERGIWCCAELQPHSDVHASVAGGMWELEMRTPRSELQMLGLRVGCSRVLHCYWLWNLGWANSEQKGSELFECSALGSALPLGWEHLEVPTDISQMIWTWREVRPRKSWWISLGFIPSTSGSIGLAICWRDGLHRNNVRLN